VKNIKATIKGSILTIEIDLSKELGPSASGKTVLIASSGGNKPVPGREDVYIGLNAYKYAKAN
jgi:hypothetical protein